MGAVYKSNSASRLNESERGVGQTPPSKRTYTLSETGWVRGWECVCVCVRGLHWHVKTWNDNHAPSRNLSSPVDVERVRFLGR